METPPPESGVGALPERMGCRSRATDARSRAREGSCGKSGATRGLEPLVVDQPLRPSCPGVLVHEPENRSQLRRSFDVRVVPQREFPRPHGGGAWRDDARFRDDEYERLEQRIPLGCFIYVHSRRGAPVRRTAVALVCGVFFQRPAQKRRVGQQQQLLTRRKVRPCRRHFGFA